MVVIKNNFHKGPYIFRCRNCGSIFGCSRDELTDDITQTDLESDGMHYDSIITYKLRCLCCGASYGYSVSDILEEAEA